LAKKIRLVEIPAINTSSNAKQTGSQPFHLPGMQVFSYTRTHIFLARTQVHTRTNSKHIVLISGATSKYNRLGNLIFYQFLVHKSLQSIKALGLL